MSRYRGVFGLCVLALLLGFLTQAGFGALWHLKSIDGAIPSAVLKMADDPESMWQDARWVIRYLNVQDGFASTVAVVSRGQIQNITRYFEGDDAREPIPHWARHYVLSLDDSVGGHDHNPVIDITLYASGWPMRSMSAMSLSSPGRPSPAITHGFMVGESTTDWNAGSRPPVVPYRPLLMGTLVNTLVWSVLFATIFVLAFGVRRLIRYESGCCPKCKYDLRRDFSRGCPECGWRRIAEANVITGK